MVLLFGFLHIWSMFAIGSVVAAYGRTERAYVGVMEWFGELLVGIFHFPQFCSGITGLLLLIRLLMKIGF